jgi:hypothetical protein
MANDDEDTKTGKRPSSRPPEGDAKESSPSEKLVKAAAEEAAAKGELAKAKAEADPDERKIEAEVAAKEAERAKEDAQEAEEAAEATGDESTAAAAEMTAAEAEKTRAEALQTAAEAEAEAKAAKAEDDDSDSDDSDDGESGDDGHGSDDEEEEEEAVPETRPALFLAEYESPDDLAHAAETVRDAGYENWDCHTPYPVHGLDQAMGLPETKIGFISFVCGMVGLASAVLMIQYMNNWDYPIIIGGKPPGSFPSMVPIMFELTVLLTGFGTLFGLFHLCRLPRHHHPIFESDRFEASTDDRFFISIEVEDPNFDLKKTRALLENTHPSHLELVEEEIA